MKEDYVADDQTADVGVDGPSSSPQQIISGENTLTSFPKKSAAPTAPSHVASSRNVDASIHASSNKDLQQPSNASPNLDTNGAPDDDQTPDPVVTLAITRDDFQAAAAPNAAPESLKKFPTNKALIEAVNNLFLETYELFTGKARMIGSGCAPNFCPLKQTRGRSRTRDPVAKLKERRDDNVSRDRSDNVNNHNKPNRNTSQRNRHNSKERSVSFSSSSRSAARPLPRQTPNSALSSDDTNNILNLLRELQCEVANFHKRISALELADQRMTHIESPLGLDPLSTPNEPDLDLMQEDAHVSHVPLNIQQPSAKSPLPPRSILTRPPPPSTIVSNTSLPSSHLSPNAPPFTPIFSTQEEINDLKNSRVVIESKLDQLTGHIKQFISSIGGASLEQADSASSV
ncbi:hypothetical protein GLOIN_2v1673942 [Rhizophagus irregularis DAOM 181602=DAOM 197198]|nr:hypothetical protein GLOIN_2v1673942 [Rhizophagus irregularis DAOM 181602=DAOM 197198]